MIQNKTLEVCLEETFAHHKSHYPQDHQRATIKSLLGCAQEFEGYVSSQAIALIARLLDLTEAQVFEVVSFYSLYDLEPVGKFKIAVCTNVSCYLRGSENLVACFRKKLNLDFGQTSEDGLFTLKEVECLAACAQAPALQVNGVYWGNVDEEKLQEWIENPKEISE